VTHKASFIDLKRTPDSLPKVGLFETLKTLLGMPLFCEKTEILS